MQALIWLTFAKQKPPSVWMDFKRTPHGDKAENGEPIANHGFPGRVSLQCNQRGESVGAHEGQDDIRKSSQARRQASHTPPEYRHSKI
jgi:hypothetical protein